MDATPDGVPAEMTHIGASGSRTDGHALRHAGGCSSDARKHCNNYLGPCLIGLAYHSLVAAAFLAQLIVKTVYYAFVQVREQMSHPSPSTWL